MRRAKIAIPPRPPGFVERPRLSELLDRCVDDTTSGPVVLVSAPAGQGKTAAVAEWMRSTASHVSTAWASLDAGDRDELDWWETVFAALAESTAVGPEHPLRWRVATSELPAVDGQVDHSVVAAALDSLDEFTGPVRLVLDDVHEIVGHPAFDGLTELLRHPLRTLVVVLCSRFDPPLRLSRLRLQGRFAEIRVRDLAFSHDDATQLYEHDDLGLTADEVRTLVERTEGWVAALRLAGLSLQDANDPAAFVREFAGDDRSVADYLVGEILTRLTPEDRIVLEAVSVCSPLPVELAAALSGRESVADTLEHLTVATAMVTPTDRRCSHYRTHELLRSHTLARLRRRDPARLAELYRRAAEWHDRHDDHPGALRHAAQAGDTSTLQQLLRARAIELLGQGEFDTLAEIERASAHAADDPRVRLALGLAAFERGELDHGEQMIESAERELAARTGHQSDNLVVFRRVVATRVALVRGHLDIAIAVGATIDPDAVAGEPLRALALSTRGNSRLTSDRRRARDDCAKALVLAKENGWPFLALQAESTLALCHTYAGEQHSMHAHAAAVVDRATDNGWRSSAWTLRAWFALASAHVLAGRPLDAVPCIDDAEAACPDGHPHFAATLAVLRGTTEHDLGGTLAGWQRIRRARTSTPNRMNVGQTVGFAALVEQEAALGLGRAREAGEVTRAMTGPLADSLELAVLQARDLWAVGDLRAASILDNATDGRHRALTSLAVVEAPLLRAAIALRRGELPTVHDQLRRVLARVTRFDVWRPLKRLTPDLRRYLAEHRGGFEDFDALVDTVLADRTPPPPTALLTRRERDVLALLPTMRSSTDIAEDLRLSINTVKTHQRGIYQKLEVDNRRDAVARARQMGLLSGGS